MISDGIMKSFHAYRNAKIPTVALIGARSGKISRQNVCQADAPSMRALSSSPIGIERRKAVNSSTLKLSWNIVARSTTPTGLSSPTRPVSWICGSATTGNGMNMAASR